MTRNHQHNAALNQNAARIVGATSETKNALATLLEFLDKPEPSLITEVPFSARLMAIACFNGWIEFVHHSQRICEGEGKLIIAESNGWESPFTLISKARIETLIDCINTGDCRAVFVQLTDP